MSSLEIAEAEMTLMAFQNSCNLQPNPIKDLWQQISQSAAVAPIAMIESAIQYALEPEMASRNVCSPRCSAGPGKMAVDGWWAGHGLGEV